MQYRDDIKGKTEYGRRNDVPRSEMGMNGWPGADGELYWCTSPVQNRDLLFDTDNMMFNEEYCPQSR